MITFKQPIALHLKFLVLSGTLFLTYFFIVHVSLGIFTRLVLAYLKKVAHLNYSRFLFKSTLEFRGNNFKRENLRCNVASTPF